MENFVILFLYFINVLIVVDKKCVLYWEYIFLKESSF